MESGTPESLERKNAQSLQRWQQRLQPFMAAAIAHHALRPVIDRVFPFDEAPDAFEYLASGAHVGKIVLVVPHP